MSKENQILTSALSKTKGVALSAKQGLGGEQQVALWRMFFENITDLVFLLDEQGRVVYMNGSSAERLHLPAEGDYNFLDILDDSYHNAFKTYSKHIFSEEKEEILFNCALRLKGSGLVFVEGGLSFLSSPVDRVRLVRGVFRDISEEIKALRVQDMYFNIVGHNTKSYSMRSLYWKIYQELHSVFSIPYFAVIYQDKRVDKVKERFFMFTYKNMSEETRKEHQLICFGLASEARKRETSFIVRHDRIQKILQKKYSYVFSKIPSVWGGVYVPTEDGHKTVVCFYSYDSYAAYSKTDLNLLDFIAKQVIIGMDRRYKALQLEEQEAKMASIVESSSHHIWSVDNNYKITSFNSYFAQDMAAHFGLPLITVGTSALSPEVIGVRKSEFLFWKSQYDKALGGNRVNFQVCLCGKDGKCIWRRVYLNPIYLSYDDISEVSVFSTDITQLKQTEEALLQAKESAEQALRAKQGFLANMSHEIRTPISGIITTLSLLEDTPLNEDQIDKTHVIRTSSETLLNILDDILHLSRVEAGKLELRASPTEFHTTFSEFMTLFKHRALVAGLRLRLHIPNDLPRYFFMDKTRILQILSNLTSNAIKFSSHTGVLGRPQSGKFLLFKKQPSCIDIGVSVVRRVRKRYMLKVSIKDKGIGIPGALIGKLFKSFSQVESSMKKTFQGTGLGLAVSKELSHLMGGDIGAYSTEGMGSTFWFTFSAALCRPPVGSRADKRNEVEIQRLDRSPWVLLVEDNHINCRMTQRLLERIGCKVEAVYSGDEAIIKAKEHVFDLILMDVQMPEKDGIETTKELHNVLDFVPPVVAITAYAMQDDRERFLKSGMDDYLAKPIRARALFDKIRHWVSQKEVREEDIIDMEVLKELMRYGDLAFVKKTVRDFFAESKKMITQMQGASESKRVGDIQFCLHTLRGSAGMLGAMAVVRQVRKMERAMKEGTKLDIPKEIQEIAGHLLKYKLYFSRFLKEYTDEANTYR